MVISVSQYSFHQHIKQHNCNKNSKSTY